MNMYLILVVISAAVATNASQNRSFYGKLRSPSKTQQVSSVTAQLAQWLIQSDNTDNVETAKVLLKMMIGKTRRQSPPQSRHHKERLQRYLSQSKQPTITDNIENVKFASASLPVANKASSKRSAPRSRHHKQRLQRYLKSSHFLN